MTRPTYDLGRLTIEGAGGDSGFRGEWRDHNEWRGATVERPRFIEVEEPGTGTSSRTLPSDHRTTPLVYVYDQQDIGQEYNDPMWNSKDYTASVRLEVVVTEDMNGRTGKEMRDAVINVLQNVQEANRAPVGESGVFGSDWRSLKVVNVDRTPTRFGNHWRAYFDVEYEALGVV